MCTIPYHNPVLEDKAMQESAHPRQPGCLAGTSSWRGRAALRPRRAAAPRWSWPIIHKLSGHYLKELRRLWCRLTGNCCIALNVSMYRWTGDYTAQCCFIIHGNQVAEYCLQLCIEVAALGAQFQSYLGLQLLC